MLCGPCHLALISSSYYCGLFPASLPEGNLNVEPHFTRCAAIRNAVWNIHIVYTSVKLYVVLNFFFHSPHFAWACICTGSTMRSISFWFSSLQCLDSFSQKKLWQMILEEQKAKRGTKDLGVCVCVTILCDSAPGLRKNVNGDSSESQECGVDIC